MHAQVPTPLPPEWQIGCDGSHACVTAEASGMLTRFTTTGPRSRAWLHGPGVAVQLPVAGAQPPWSVERVSRDQIELLCCPRDAKGQPFLLARQILTADAWGLHLALAVERCRGRAMAMPWGFELNLAATAAATLQVPSGTLGGGVEGRSPDAPFGWPRRSILTHGNGDRLELCAYAPLSRVELRRRADQVELRLLSPAVVHVGETARVECRLAARLAAA